MPKKVLISEIEIKCIQDIVNHYNNNKDPENEPIEILDRCEGGFKIKLKIKNKDQNDFLDDNQKIKQLRWNHKYLLPYQNTLGFSKKEELLLFKSMKKVLGENVVF